MANVIDYLKEYKDIPLKKEPFNELDALIFARLSYIDFSSIVNNSRIRKRKLVDAINEMLLLKGNSYRFRLEEDKMLIDLLRASLRFKDVYIKGYIKDTDPDLVKQFSAVTFCFTAQAKKFLYISFRGTDGTYTGRKEDFDMSYKDIVPAQEEASKYLRKTLNFSSYKTIYIGGHSKGGNLAIYAASTLRKNIQNNIVGIYCFDSPGFQSEILLRPGFQEIKNKIYHYAPQSSIIGRLLYKDYPTTVISSKKSLLYQHNVYNWEVKKTKIIRENKFTFISNKFDKELKDNLKLMSYSEREEFVNEVFKIVKELSVDDKIDFSGGVVNFAKRFRNILKAESANTQRIIKSLFSRDKEESEVNYVEPVSNKKPVKIIEKIKNAYDKVGEIIKNDKDDIVVMIVSEDNKESKKRKYFKKKNKKDAQEKDEIKYIESK